MTDAVYRFLSIDLPPLLAGTLAALLCGLLGNFLVLRRQSLMGDAISHSVLPGLVIAFMLTGSRGAVPMLLGAGVAGVVAVAMIEFLRRAGRTDPGAAMGVTFSILFALGVLLIERAQVRGVHIGADVVLYGQLETLFWHPPDSWGALLTLDAMRGMPPQVVTIAVMAVAAFIFVGMFYKELRIASFDPGGSTSLGVHAGAVHYALMVVVAAATVVSFEAVGSILVIAMLICPAATARLLTDSLRSQLVVSCAVAVVGGVGGYCLGAFAPPALGLGGSVNAAGSIVVALGGLFVLAAVCSPSHGVIAAQLRQRAIAQEVRMDDLVASLFRAEERGGSPGGPFDRCTVRRARNKKLVAGDLGTLGLTGKGQRRGAAVVRRHRLWEGYLVDKAGLAPDHVHDAAERLEHLRGVGPAQRGATGTDPHGKPIPPADN